MVQAPPRPQKDRPWDAYRSESAEHGQNRRRHKPLQPGWAGHLDDDELRYIMEHLKADEKLQLWWGIPPRWKRIREETVKRVAMDGDPDDMAHNRRLARPRQSASGGAVA
jgi:hypothetical protein